MLSRNSFQRQRVHQLVAPVTPLPPALSRTRSEGRMSSSAGNLCTAVPFGVVGFAFCLMSGRVTCLPLEFESFEVCHPDPQYLFFLFGLVCMPQLVASVATPVPPVPSPSAIHGNTPEDSLRRRTFARTKSANLFEVRARCGGQQ